jgi:hypothetical protein
MHTPFFNLRDYKTTPYATTNLHFFITLTDVIELLNGGSHPVITAGNTTLFIGPGYFLIRE